MVLGSGNGSGNWSLMEDVALKPAALTRWAALHVPVYQDTPEMDLVVQVSHTE